MKKRARTYGEKEVDVDLPDSIVAAMSKTPKQPPPPQPRPKPKAFANFRSHGYGGPNTPWPFDRIRAYNDPKYRAGIRNAIAADWTASNWKFDAQRLLLEVTEDLLAAHIMVEDLEREERDLQENSQ